MRSMRHVVLRGMAAHIGSQVSQSEPYALTARQLLELCNEIRGEGITTLEHMDIGGGLAVSYGDEAPSDLREFADAIRPIAAASGLQLLMEPGRYLVADSGTLVTRVVYRKHSGGKEIVITDAGMNDLIRPALYEAYHAIEAVDASTETITADVVGPVCESGDFFGLDRTIANVQQGDLVAIRSAGAYGYVMASNYNSRPRPPEVLVDGSRFAVVTERERYEDLVHLERPTPTWSEA